MSVPATADDAKLGELQQRLASEIDASSKTGDKVKGFVKDHVFPLMRDAVLVTETATQNGRNVSLDEIEKIDEKWQAAEELLDVQSEKLQNACAKRRVEFVGQYPAVVEVFVMDNQGANVGQNALTSDYWQGDAPKWQNAYKDGQGGVDVAEPKLDKSSNIVIQQISVPILDEQGKAIGAICVGVNVDKL